MRDANERTAFLRTIEVYLGARQRPWPPHPVICCARCGQPIEAGDGRIDPALLYYARRCARCYDSTSVGQQAW